MDDAKPLVSMQRKWPFSTPWNGCRHHRIVKASEMLLAANGHVQRKDTWENVLGASRNTAHEEEHGRLLSVKLATPPGNFIIYFKIHWTTFQQNEYDGD